MDRTILLATGNPHKVVELRDLLEGSAWTVKALDDFETVPEPLEDGDTFKANAILKARYYAQKHGLRCVADDSGLVVDALEGAPGVYSARYAGENCTYDDNNRKLLSALEGVEAEKRTARFVCCAAVYIYGEWPHTETGVVEGRIAMECRGEKGFGYDPLFIPEGEERSFGEMSLAEKQRISHRARAFARVKRYLDSLR